MTTKTNRVLTILVPLLCLGAFGCAKDHGPSGLSPDGGTGIDSGIVQDSGTIDPDSGGDSGPFACPADHWSLLGMPCTEEGLSCGGPCENVCSFCNLAVCVTGEWVRLEAFPAPCFACGAEECVELDEYCHYIRSDVGGVADFFECLPLPSACEYPATCACMGEAGGHCTEDEAKITIEHGGA